MNQLLLVEDEPLERQALKMELETGDYDISEIYEASNGQEALDLFEEKHPDILIVDINIPVLSGLDFIERIVNSGAESKILITTTYDRSRYVRTAISLGVTDYLMLTGYKQLMTKGEAYRLEILSRGISFYVCMIISMVAVAIGYIVIKRKKSLEKRK